jgi:hypothetical protein
VAVVADLPADQPAAADLRLAGEVVDEIADFAVD